MRRRNFLQGAAAAALAFGGLKALNARALAAGDGGYGPLIPDPAGLLDLPSGFSYRAFSRTGDPMSDGLLTPGGHDGMACFPARGARDKVLLVRNHEMWPNLTGPGAFGADHSLAAKISRDKIFDFAPDGAPKLGGTTTLLYDLKGGTLERAHLSLAGTCGNCCGGPTPWGSWLTCEETIEAPGAAVPLVSRDHGYVFEVPSRARGLVDPVPLVAMGRFVHEAAAVDPKTGIVYMTEDNPAGLFYRFLPDRKGRLKKGGRLQALALKDGRARDLRNWPADGTAYAGQGAVAGLNAPFEVEWIDMDGVESPDGDLKERGHAKGALRFARGEGLAWGAMAGRGEIYISCTMGGPARLGQVWRYRPSAEEGRRGERDAPGTLELFVESPGADVLKHCDNVAVAPWGDLVLCEDSYDGQPQFLRGVTPEGRLYDIAMNGYSEFAGACFSPDGSTMFVNVQAPGITFAIRGPWRRRDA